MKKQEKVIAFVLPENALPVPATEGGAIETLLSLLLEQNELFQQFYFIMISPKGNKENKAKLNYNFAKIYHLPVPQERIKREKRKEHGNLQKLFGKIHRRLNYYYSRLCPKGGKYYRHAYKIIKNEKADYVISEGYIPWGGIIVFQKFGKNRMACHLHHHFKRESIWDDIYEKYLATSKFIADEWGSGYDNKENILVLQNCIDASRFEKRITYEERENLRRKLGFKEDDYVVLFCGRIIPEKGVKELIDAVLSIKEENVKLLLIGSSDFARGNSGDYVETIIRKVKENILRIFYVGYVDNTDLYQYYQCADVQVIPSLWEEAAGLVTLEGMLSKLPLIITRSGGMVEYIDERYTEIVERDEEISKHLRDKIEFLKDNPKRRKEMAENAFVHAQKYSAEFYYQQFAEIIKGWRI